tara:strand:+ start:174 stop:485 length:312 start_codon:yes stop_codon:yes gene_type:complete
LLRVNELTGFLFSCLKAAEITTIQTQLNYDTMKYPIGTEYLTRGKHPRLCTVTDIWKTYDSKGDLVRKRYVATHDVLGQTVTDRDVVEVTIARGVQALKEKQA